MNRSKLLVIAGYNTFFWVCFWMFAYWTFPYDRVAVYLTDKVAQSGLGYTMEVGELSPYWFTGVELEDVKLKRTTEGELPAPPTPGKPADDGFHIKEARARVGIFALIFGNTSLNFDAELEQGDIEGAYEESGEEKHVEAELSKVDVGKLGLLESVISLPIKGTVGGDFDLTLGKDPTKSTGTAKLRIEGLTIGDGTAKLKVGSMGGLTIDPVEAGTVTVELDVKEGVGTVKKLSNDGKDLELEGSGEVRLSDPLSRSRVDMLLRLKITENYRNKTPRAKTLMSLLDGVSVSQVRAAKTADGSFQYRLAGTLSGLRAVPAGRSHDSGPNMGSRPGGRPVRSGVSEPAMGAGESDEE
jgi:type II secretion system protein N